MGVQGDQLHFWRVAGRRAECWGASGWEVISIARMNGTVTITGNKMFVVLKRRSRAVEAVVSAASDYLGELRGYYGPAFDQVKQPLW